MAAPLGNKNATKSKEWTAALKWQLENYENETSSIKRGTALRTIAKQVVEAALSGDKDSWQEIGNRLDGKPAQAIIGDDDSPPIQIQGRIKLIKP